MKKLLTVVLATLMIITLAGCSKKEEEKEVVGGYTKVEDGKLTDELIEIFNKALEGYDGMHFEPVELLETQVVAGINYRFLAIGTPVVPNATSSEKIVTIYKDLKGNCSITNIEDK